MLTSIGPWRFRTLKACLPVAVSLVLGILPAEAQQVVVGRVTDELSGVPLEGVQVMLKRRDVEDEGTLVTTDAQGRFAASLPGPGDYVLRTWLRRYEPTLYPLTIRDTPEPVEIVVQLKPQPVELDGIVVEVEEELDRLRLDLVGFTRRARRGGGHFVGPEDLEEKRRNLRRLFIGIPGVRMTHDENLRMSTRGTECSPEVWVDGMPLARGVSLRLAVSEQALGAIEIYNKPLWVPAQYRSPTNSGCGTVLIWTRR